MKRLEHNLLGKDGIIYSLTRVLTKISRISRLAFYSLFPAAFWTPYTRKAKAAGFDRLYLTLSFDCDTDEDIPAAERIHEWLKVRGAAGVFAVPGVQLMKGADVFRQMAAEGAEFINHGAAAHTEWRENRYWSVNFYDQLSRETVERDIRTGHEIVTRVTGTAPAGFRAPHFGHFQEPEQLAWLYGLLRELGYRYASTTLPRFLLAHGPCAPVDGLVEFPVTGTYSKPLNLFDSWGRLVSYDEPHLKPSYFDDFVGLVDRLQASKTVGLINHYVDPAHVVKGGYFFRAIQYALDRGLEFVTYGQLLDRISL